MESLAIKLVRVELSPGRAKADLRKPRRGYDLRKTALEFTNALNVLRTADIETGQTSRLFSIIERTIEQDRAGEPLSFEDGDRDWLNENSPPRNWELSGSSLGHRHFVADRWHFSEPENLDDLPRQRVERQSIWLFLQYLSDRLSGIDSKSRISRCEYCGEYFLASRSDKKYCSDSHRALFNQARRG